MSMVVREGAKHVAKKGGEHLDRKRQGQAMIETAVANGVPGAAEASIAASKSRTKRTAIIAGSIVFSLLAAGGVLGYGIDRAGNAADKLLHDIFGAAPHPTAALAIQNQLNSVQLSENTIMVQGNGTSAAALTVELQSGTAVVGPVWNFLGASLTKMTASAKRQGNVQDGVNAGGIELSLVTPPATATDKKPSPILQASVNTDSVFSQVSGMSYLEHAGGDGFFVRLAGLVGVSSDQVSRDADVTSWADSDFQDTCGQAIVPDLPYGIANFVSNVMLKPAESLLTKQDPAAANLLGQLAVPGNIHVVFDSTQVMDHGRVSTTRPIPISSVVVPQLFVPGSAQVASELGVSKSDVTVDTATNMCLFTPNAVGDQTAIAGGGQ